MPSDNQPTLGILAGCCASAAGGTVSRLRMSVTMHPMALHHMGFSSRQPHADLLLSLEAGSESDSNRYALQHISVPFILRGRSRTDGLCSASHSTPSGSWQPCPRIGG